MRIVTITLFVLLVVVVMPAGAQAPEVGVQGTESEQTTRLAQSENHSPVQNRQAGKVVVRGVVSSAAAHTAIIGRLRELYGAAAVIDHLQVDEVYAPPQWSEHIGRLLNPSLKQVSDGELRIDGNTVVLRGDVANEALRQKVLSVAAASLNPTYTIKDALTVVAQSTQTLLDDLLGDRTIAFESGSAVIAAGGRRLLGEVAAIVLDAGDTRLLIAGHTDNVGTRRNNILLSIQRASAVKAYLVERGVDAGMLSVMGYGPDRPLASNDTPEGRAKNRRIEFVVGG